MAGWEIKRLGDVCELQNGFAFKSKLFKPSGIPVVRISSIQEEQICDHRPVFTDPNDYKEDLTKYRVEDGDLLIAMSGATTGKVGFNRTGKTFLLNQRVGKFEPSSKLDIDYLFYYLSTKVEENLAISAGSAQPNLSTKQIKGFEIPLPPLPEQKRIVAILDEAFAGINAAVANTGKNLANARELFESYLNGVFTRKGDGWVEKKLGDVCDLISGQHIDSKNYNTKQKGIGYLTGPADFGVINPTVSKWTEFPKRTALRGDILITVKGSGVGKINLLDHEELAISRQLMAVRAKGAKTEFLYEFLSLQFSYFQSLANGAAIPGISRSDVLNLKLSMPNQSEQGRIVAVIDEYKAQTLRLETIYKQKLSALAELKQSILQKAFAGELTARPEKTVAKAVA